MFTIDAKRLINPDVEYFEGVLGGPRVKFNLHNLQIALFDSVVLISK